MITCIQTPGNLGSWRSGTQRCLDGPPWSRFDPWHNEAPGMWGAGKVPPCHTLLSCVHQHPGPNWRSLGPFSWTSVPWTSCMTCNSSLVSVEKKIIFLLVCLFFFSDEIQGNSEKVSGKVGLAIVICLCISSLQVILPKEFRFPMFLGSFRGSTKCFRKKSSLKRTNETVSFFCESKLTNRGFLQTENNWLFLSHLIQKNVLIFICKDDAPSMIIPCPGNFRLRITAGVQRQRQRITCWPGEWVKLNSKKKWK